MSEISLENLNEKLDLILEKLGSSSTAIVTCSSGLDNTDSESEESVDEE